MKVRFGVSVLSGTAFPHRRDLDKFAELIRIIDGSGVELIGTNDTSFIGGDAYVRATLIAQTAKTAHVGIHPTNLRWSGTRARCSRAAARTRRSTRWPMRAGGPGLPGWHR